MPSKTRLDLLRESFKQRREDLQKIFNTDPEELDDLFKTNPNALGIYLWGCATVGAIWGVVELIKLV